MAEISVCPRCSNEIGEATSCKCGWKLRQRKKAGYQPREFERVACAHEECGIAAMCRIKTPTGWASLCWQHYDQHFADQAKANCAAKGLTTTAQLREAFKAGTATLVRRLRSKEVLVQREPGEDWDEAPIDEAAIAEQHALAARLVAGEVGPEAGVLSKPPAGARPKVNPFDDMEAP